MGGANGDQHVRLTVETGSIIHDDAFPDFSDPNLFSASSPTLSPADCSSISEASGSRSSFVISPGGASTSSASTSGGAVAPSGAGAGGSNLGGGLGGLGGGVSSANSSGTGSRFLLPLPTPSSNASQTSFALSEVSVGGEDGDPDGHGFPALSPEILSADISISGTFPSLHSLLVVTHANLVWSFSSIRVPQCVY